MGLRSGAPQVPRHRAPDGEGSIMLDGQPSRIVFVLLSPGGSWQVLQPYGAATTYPWDTSGSVPGTYNFQVWARQQREGQAYDAWTSFSYQITPASPCTSVSTSVSPSLVPQGSLVQ